MRTVVISLLGTNLDRRGGGKRRFETWRPNVALCQHEDLVVDRLELLFDGQFAGLARQVQDDVETSSPETRVALREVGFPKPWDFESVYAALLDFARDYAFDHDNERYLIHITTGTHVAQICLYLLTETHYLPGQLIQTSPTHGRRGNARGSYQLIDLDLSRYDQIASRFSLQHDDDTAQLKRGINTRNADFNAMIAQLETVCANSTAPILLTGATGSGKTQLARQVFALKKKRGQLSGRFVDVNCATLRGDNVASTLFGHVKGAYTGATGARAGLLKEADKGLLFLDEIAELGVEEQTMLLQAIEEKSFLPFGSDAPASSDFQLIAGTNRDLRAMVSSGAFREDLLARIDLWSYRLPSLRERIEDLEPNLEFELNAYAATQGTLVTFNRDARRLYMQFARSDEALWSANFRDLNGSVVRMATLSRGGRITVGIVEDEIERLRTRWRGNESVPAERGLADVVAADVLAQMDRFDRLQLHEVVSVCRRSASLAQAGRELFDVSRLRKRTRNDSHRLRVYLQKHGLHFDDLS
ncbi:MAG: RNA repair transcriptional activator RtcR [Gammaproteobacteria bacterium]